eukprot:scaffold1791_cov143-Isochrysis_galbana.AAC.1
MAPNAACAAVLWCMCERVWPECAIARRRSAPLRPWQNENVLEQARALDSSAEGGRVHREKRARLPVACDGMSN